LKHIGILKPDTFIKILNFIGIPATLFYAFSMLVYPWIDNRWNWGQVQNVWDRWQSLNVGVLAFIASITAFNISRFKAKKQRERDFLATKAFLPSALSELVGYFKASAAIFIKGWDVRRGQRLEVTTPRLPEGYKEVFQECIRYAEPDVGDYLSKILVRLQIHNSRLEGFVTAINDVSDISPNRHNLISYLYRLGELQALVGKLFPFARNEEDFDSNPLSWEDFRNAYGGLEVWIEDFRIDDTMNLEDFTKRAIARGENT
jgi:hypothetical protein